MAFKRIYLTEGLQYKWFSSTHHKLWYIKTRLEINLRWNNKHILNQVLARSNYARNDGKVEKSEYTCFRVAYIMFICVAFIPIRISSSWARIYHCRSQAIDYHNQIFLFICEPFWYLVFQIDLIFLNSNNY